jgi:hypothetical protein
MPAHGLAASPEERGGGGWSHAIAGRVAWPPSGQIVEAAWWKGKLQEALASPVNRRH